MIGRAGRLGLTYGAGAAGALAAVWLRVPLPWLLGPLVVTGIASALGPPRPVVPGSRQAGQWIVGAALGLYFTREVLATLSGALHWMLLSCVAALATGMAGASLMRRRARLSPATAFYAAVPGGAAEMAVFGEREGGDPAVIALSQALRVAAVVTVVPLALQLWGARGADAWAPQALPATPGGLLRLALWSGGAGLAAQAVRVPNGWLLGPLAASAFLTASGRGASAVPRGLIDAAQLLIGCALGHRFERELIRSARVLLPALGMAVVQGMLLLGAFAGLLSLATGRSAYTMLLATAPGGIAEMCLTARTLQLGVPLVTAFHVVRLVAVLTLAPATYRLWLRSSSERRTGLPGSGPPPKSVDAERLTKSRGPAEELATHSPAGDSPAAPSRKAGER